MKDEPKYNRVLLNGSAFFRPYKTKGGGNGMFADGSSLPFLLEELVAYSARQIAIPPSNLAGFVSSLPEGWRRRIALVDENRTIVTGLLKLFEPIGDEFGMQFSSTSIEYTESQVGLEELRRHAIGAFVSLYPFLIGLKHQLQIDIDAPGLARLLQEVRLGLTDKETRRKLATLEGALRSYAPSTLPGLKCLAPTAPDLADILDELLDDEIYRSLSNDAKKVGFPSKMRQAKDDMLRKARAIVRKPQFKGVYGVSGVGLAVATQIPAPDNDTVQSLLGAKFLPPIVDIRTIINRARKSWFQTKPDPVPPPGVEIGELLDFEDDDSI